MNFDLFVENKIITIIKFALQRIDKCYNGKDKNFRGNIYVKNKSNKHQY